METKDIHKVLKIEDTTYAGIVADYKGTVARLAELRDAKKASVELRKKLYGIKKNDARTEADIAFVEEIKAKQEVVEATQAEEPVEEVEEETVEDAEETETEAEETSEEPAEEAENKENF